MATKKKSKQQSGSRGKSLKFKECVESAAHPSVCAAFRLGLTAFGAYSTKITCSDPRKFKGSIDIDSALADDPAFARLNRWDYGFGFQADANKSEIAVWVEIHSAHTSEVSVVIKKKNWLKDYLAQNCEDLWKITSGAKRPLFQFYWIASNGVHISKNSPQARALASSGIPWPQKILSVDW